MNARRRIIALPRRHKIRRGVWTRLRNQTEHLSARSLANIESKKNCKL